MNDNWSLKSLYICWYCYLRSYVYVSWISLSFILSAAFSFLYKLFILRMWYLLVHHVLRLCTGIRNLYSLWPEITVIMAFLHQNWLSMLLGMYSQIILKKRMAEIMEFRIHHLQSSFQKNNWNFPWAFKCLNAILKVTITSYLTSLLKLAWFCWELEKKIETWVCHTHQNIMCSLVVMYILM